MTPPVDDHAGSARPLLLVDVDGVLAVIDGYGDPRTEVVEVTFEAEFEARGFPILVPTGTRERFATLETLFDCVWATSREHHAPESLSPTLGFGAGWPVIQVWEGASDIGTMKLPAIQRFADLPENRDRPLAWIDDDLEPDAFEWAALRTRGGASTLMVRPDPDSGITKLHYDELVTFAEECSTRASSR
jgi:hypothetical protein